VFEKGVGELERLGLRVRELPTARMDAAELYRNPKIRAEDVNEAFADKDVKAIVASIGGDESVRILKHLDWKAIQARPKILMGFSDTTTLLTTLNQQGLVTFHGPMVMAGCAQLSAFPKWRQHVKGMLFTTPDVYEYEPFETFAEGYPDWSDTGRLGDVSGERPSTGWKWLQGSGRVTGTLFGGCIEVFEFLKATEFWPGPDFWKDRIFFLETSEEKPPVCQVQRMLRNYGVQGIFERISALLLGRAMHYTDEEKRGLDEAVVATVAGEFGNPDLPIVTEMDFGHTDPQHILPLGVRAWIDCDAKSFGLLESPLLD
jgi:muramoyltetrapeptide carboxypeptidase LdcA involved in peptidoglycan recycling